MVPLYFIKKKLPKTKIVVVGLSRLPLITNYQFGMLIKEAIDNTNKKVVFVASGDLSHKLQEYGPYGFVKEGPIYDERIMDVLSNKRFNEGFHNLLKRADRIFSGYIRGQLIDALIMALLISILKGTWMSFQMFLRVSLLWRPQIGRPTIL